QSGIGQILFERAGVLLAQSFNEKTLTLSGEPGPVAKIGAANFSASDNGVLVYRNVESPDSQLAWLDRHGNLLGVIGPPGDYKGLALAPDGRRVAFVRNGHSDKSIWVLDLIRGADTRVTVGSGPMGRQIPVWSPDGDRIVFLSHSFELGEKAANGTGEERPLF